VISNEYKCIHVHIPRTGGSSIEAFFAGKTTLNPTGLSIRADHRSIHDYRSNRRFEEYFKFTIVRNPWSKMVSHFIRNCINRPPKTFEGEYQPRFKKWIKHLPVSGNGRGRSYNKLSFKTCNQLGWLCDERWKDNIAPEEWKLDVDFVGRFENLEEDWDFISQKIGSKEKLLHMRRGILSDENVYPVDYREYYDDETIEIVCQRYKDDINFFNYEFE